MDKSICYTVICHFPSLCQPVRSVKTHTTIGFVTRNGRTVYDPQNYPTQSPLLQPTTASTTTKPPTTATTPARRTCLQSMVYFSVALRGGWTSGKFTDMGVVKGLRECVNHCCNDTTCDLAMVLSRKCFTVHCYSLADCQTIPDGHAQIAYVTREGVDGVVPVKPTKNPDEAIHHSTRAATRRPTPTFSPTLTRSDPNLVLHLTFDKIDENRIVDESKYGNDATLTSGANISPGGGIRGNGVMLDGGDVLLDGEHFNPKPRQAITISVWVKLLEVSGVHSVFDTVGSNSDHHNGQYHFEVVDGKVRWFHRDENAEQVFSVTTEPVVKSNRWTHIAALYDSNLGEAKIFVNGLLKTVDVGHGELSMDWGAKAGFGTHTDGRALLGYVDDIYIYSRALDRLEILDYVRSFKESLAEKENENQKAVEKPQLSISKPIEVIYTNRLETTEKPKLKTTATTAKLADVCQLGKIYASSDLKGGLNAGNFLDRGPVNTISQCMEMCCMFPTCDLSYMLSGRCYLVECYSQDVCGIIPKGLSSLAPTVGMVTRPSKLKSTTTIRPEVPTTVTTTTKPPVTTKKPPRKPHKPPKILQQINDFESQLLHPDASWYTTTKKPTPPTCIFGPVLNHTTMIGGLRAGDISHKGQTKTMDICQELCCNVSSCDVAIMMKGACFLVSCKNKTLCKPRHAQLPNFSLKLSYKKRPGQRDLSYDYEHPTTTTTTTPKPTTKTTVTPKATTKISKTTTTTAKTKPDVDTVELPKIPSSRVKSWCSADFILEGVKLIGGLHAGAYRTIGHMDSIDICMEHCCESQGCTVAYLDKGTCYAMQCVDRDLCKATIADSHSSIGYVIRDGKSLFKNAQEAVTDVIFKKPGGLHMSLHASNGSVDAVVNGNDASAHADSSNATKPTKPVASNESKEKQIAHPTVAIPQSSQGMDIGYCEKGETLENQRLMGGMKAGVFRDHGEVADLDTCSEYCCRDKECHLAYMIDKNCYSVNCYNSELCKTFKAPNFFLNPVISFVSRIKNSTDSHVSTTAKPKPTTVTTTKKITSRKATTRPSKHHHQPSKEEHKAHSHSHKLKQEHKHHPTLSEQMKQDMKMASHYRKLLQHHRLMALLQKIELGGGSSGSGEGSGSGSGSGEGSGSGHPSFLNLAHMLESSRPRTKNHNRHSHHKTHHGHHNHHHRHHKHEVKPKSGEKRKISKSKDEVKFYPVPLSEVDVDMINALSSGDPSDYESCPAEEFSCEHYCITLLHGGHRCMCHKGYRLALDGRHCLDEDQCDSNSHTCDQICVFDENEYRCECRTGYTRSILNNTCDDIDECAMGIHGCEQICVNTPGSYRCLCSSGFRLNDDHMTCIDLATPNSLMKKSNIQRPPRFLIPAMIVNGPNDTDVQQGHNVILSCAAHGHPTAKFAWSFGLQESKPLTGDSRIVALPGGNLLIQNARMSDAGVYRCIASNNAGTDTAEALLRVKDTDECQSGLHRCEHQCHNTIGSFFCSCYAGYALQEDSFTCQDVNECAQVSNDCSQYCYNTPGSFVCGCKDGYKLHPNKRNCIDIDECQDGHHSCSQVCNNTNGSYNCTCLKGYKLKKDNITCEKVSFLHLSIMSNDGPISAGFGAMVAFSVLLIGAVLGTSVILIRNYKKRRKYNQEERGQFADGPPMKIHSNSKSIFSWVE